MIGMTTASLLVVCLGFQANCLRLSLTPLCFSCVVFLSRYCYIFYAERLQTECQEMQMRLEEALAGKDMLQAECDHIKEKIHDLQIIVDEVIHIAVLMSTY